METTPIIMCGAAGRMGQMITKAAANDPAFTIAGALEYAASPALGRPLGEIIGEPGVACPIVGDLERVDRVPGAVIIDFTSPEATQEHIAWAAEKKIAAVIGTTGLTAVQRGGIEAASHEIPVVFAPNMSVGVNTLFRIVEETARILGEAYDVEISEMHHRFKKDAPSGTARRLGEIVAGVMNGTYEDLVVDGRSGMPGERPARQIGMHALRGGDVVGEHTVSFTTLGERIELTHRAHSRETFARGALRAAAWLSGRPAGLYDMQDVLGLR